MTTCQTHVSKNHPSPRSLARARLMQIAAHGQQQRVVSSRVSMMDAPNRKQLERFIHSVFRNVYGADVTHFMPQMLSLHDQQEQVLAVCGMRSAANQALFLEAYLDQPVEAALSERVGSTVLRKDIVEIGNLAVAELGLARQLLQEVINHLHATDAQWAVFTAIPALRNSLGKLSVQLEVLGDADINRLEEADRAGWGSYYQQHPQVMAVRRLPDDAIAQGGLVN